MPSCTQAVLRPRRTTWAADPFVASITISDLILAARLEAPPGGGRYLLLAGISRALPAAGGAGAPSSPAAVAVGNAATPSPKSRDNQTHSGAAPDQLLMSESLSLAFAQEVASFHGIQHPADV